MYYDYLLVPVIGASGEVEAVAGTTRDVTERKQLERSLIDADRRKDEFLATLAHELRNPLAPIRNAVHLLKTGNPTEDNVRAAREIIDRQVHHMVRLVDDLMDVSRITRRPGQSAQRTRQPAPRARRCARGRRAGDRSRQSPAGRRRSGRVTAARRRRARGCRRCSRTCSTTPPSTRRRGGTITLRAELRGDQIVVSVRDTGIGIASDMQPRVFELFTRVHPGDRIKTSGLGIGLSLAKKLIELHLGNIEVRSEGPGKGSEFIVTLPALAATPAPTPPSRAH